MIAKDGERNGPLSTTRSVDDDDDDDDDMLPHVGLQLIAKMNDLE